MVRIILGAATTLVLAALFYLILSVAVDPLLRATVLGVGKLATPATEELLGLVGVIGFLVHLAAALLALTAGSLVASGPGGPYPVFRSAVSAALAALCALTGVILAVRLWLQQPVEGPAEAYTRAENLELVQAWIAAGFVVLPLAAALAGYVLGRFGQPTVRRIARR